MTKSLDDIMSGRSESVSEEAIAPATIESAPAAPEAGAGASRDDKGRFAATQPEAATVEPEVPVAQPAPVQQPSGHVPIQALDAERGKRRELEDRYDRDMRELRAQLAKLSQPSTPAEPPKPVPTMWDDPDAYMQHQLQTVLTPLQEEQRNNRNLLMQMQASQQYGADKVKAAFDAARAIEDTPAGKALEAQILSGGNPFGNLVEWHQRQTMQAEIGGDLEAYKAKIIADHMASQGQQQSQPSPTPQPAPAPTLPTAFAKTPAGGPRGGAEYGGPRPLSEIMGGR